ncbi:hypothetical protein F8M41_015141 [Gigaspora margarita]|uniref:Uncharacterized protein n=1 Tax=Gigaspora margarita TaxID=4874 RepID=A0A8H3WWU2_GIGMA|nr:hypothetical protein F8M41_015141 [Gigaspora margarita]
MPATVTALCYITDFRKSSKKYPNITVVDAMGITRSRGTKSELVVNLVGFYREDTAQDLKLSEFKTGDVVLATGRFRVEGDNNQSHPILKIVLNEVVCLKIDPKDFPIFPINISMTATVQQVPTTMGDYVHINVKVEDHLDQEYVSMQMSCNHLKSVNNMKSATSNLKENTMLYLDGEFMIDNERTNLVYLRRITLLSDYQKQNTVSKASTRFPWDSDGSNHIIPANNTTQTIAKWIKGSGRHKPY